MRLLFAISVASFCAVLWIALSLARRIQRDRLRRCPAPQGPAAEFFEAGDYRTPRPMKLKQQVASMRARPADAGTGQADSASGAPSGPVRYLWPSAPAKAASAPVSEGPRSFESGQQPAQVIDSTLEFVRPGHVGGAFPYPRPLRAYSISAVRPVVAAAQSDSPAPSAAAPAMHLSAERRPPQSARSVPFRRVDLSHYNEDMGDLTDPYTNIVRPSGVRRAAKSS